MIWEIDDADRFGRRLPFVPDVYDDRPGPVSRLTAARRRKLGLLSVDVDTLRRVVREGSAEIVSTRGRRLWLAGMVVRVPGTEATYRPTAAGREAAR